MPAFVLSSGQDKRPLIWLLNKNARAVKSRGLVYALVNLRKECTDFLVPNCILARNVRVTPPTKTRKNY